MTNARTVTFQGIITGSDDAERLPTVVDLELVFCKVSSGEDPTEDPTEYAEEQAEQVKNKDISGDSGRCHPFKKNMAFPLMFACIGVLIIAAVFYVFGFLYGTLPP